ncbi:MAG TPA: ABC transporter permease [Pyrinomonadaceae bacterium]|nr:ABC transporter permease [Pyrinomonadaceae bacterium]
METLFKDIRYGIRSLLKQPGFTAIVVLTLALGIGASTAIFSVVNSVLLRQLPYRQSERIVAIQELNNEGRLAQVTAPNFLDWRAQNTVFEHLAAIKEATGNLAFSDGAERIEIAQTSANFFEVFQITPAQGRLFISADEQAGHEPIIVLSHVLWQRRFGSDPSLIGKPLTLDGKNYTVVGVAPPGFQYPDKTEAWLPPLRLVPELFESMDVTQHRRMGYLEAVALLKSGTSLTQAASEMETITGRLRQQYPETNNNRFNRVVSLHKHLVGDTDSTLWLLFGAVTFVLLIACANVANLLLANAAARQKEMAVRAALGASRLRIVRQLLTESAMLAIAGGGVGLLISIWGVAFLTRLLPTDFPRIDEIQMDWRVLGFTLGTSLITGFLFGLAPALHLAKTDVQQAMKESGRASSGGVHRSRFRQALIVAEVSLSVVLLVGAGLLFRSFLQLRAVNPGFTSHQVLTARLSPSGNNFRSNADYANYHERVMQRIAAIPGVIDAGAINTLPLGKGPSFRFRVEGRPPTTPDKWPPANLRVASPNYFRTMKVPVLQGRSFTERDNEQAPRAIIVNQALAQQNFASESPIGKRLNFGNTDENKQPIWSEIVGVVANVRSLELKEEPKPEIYLSSLQDPSWGMSLVIRTTTEPEALAPTVRQAVTEVDKSVPISEVKAMDHVVAESVMQPRFNMVLLTLFSSIALLLSAAGIYGVTAYSVTQRTHELGIRLALGAQLRDVLALIMRQGMIVILIGLVIGLAASFAFMRLLRSLLFGVTLTDPVTFAAISLLLTVVALLACYIPARRATKVDPVIALRYE